jgi:hypothetical protein
MRNPFMASLLARELHSSCLCQAPRMGGFLGSPAPCGSKRLGHGGCWCSSIMNDPVRPAWRTAPWGLPVHDAPRVLVAEDDSEMRRLVVETLRKERVGNRRPIWSAVRSGRLREEQGGPRVVGIAGARGRHDGACDDPAHRARDRPRPPRQRADGIVRGRWRAREDGGEVLVAAWFATPRL